MNNHNSLPQINIYSEQLASAKAKIIANKIHLQHKQIRSSKQEPHAKSWNKNKKYTRKKERNRNRNSSWKEKETYQLVSRESKRNETKRNWRNLKNKETKKNELESQKVGSQSKSWNKGKQRDVRVPALFPLCYL